MASARTPAPLRAALSFNQMAKTVSLYFAGAAGLVVDMKYAILLLVSVIFALVWIYYEYLYPIPGEDDDFCLEDNDYNHKQMVAEESKLGCYVVICFCVFLAAIFWASE